MPRSLIALALCSCPVRDVSSADRIFRRRSDHRRYAVGDAATPHDLPRHRPAVSRPHREVRRRPQRDHHPQPARAPGGGRARSRAARRERFADRCTAFPSRSRTTSTRPTCRQPAGRRCSIGFVPPYEATITRNLRDAGAIIIAKTNMTELANWVASGMPGNYNSLVGYGLNPYDPRRDPRPGTDDGRPALSTGGSSSGTGTAANFWAANVGTETSGSILSPANSNNLVGIKPTVGRISRYGVIPITADQDTPGPMARTVADAAILARRSRRRGVRTPTIRRRKRARAYREAITRDF